MSHFTLFLNKNNDKIVFDRIAVYKKEDCFIAYYKSDVTKETYENKTPVVIRLETHHDLLDYLEDIMDLMYFDIDQPSHSSIDLAMPAYPVVALNPKLTSTKNLLFRAVRSWSKKL